MAKTKVDFNSQLLQQDLKTFAKNFCQAVADESKYYIWEFARRQIEGYYAEYDPPRYYRRTGQELNYSFHIFSERANNAYRGGIVFDHASVLHEKAGVDEDYIENMVWRLGYHGHEIVGYKSYDGTDTRRWTPIKGEPDRFAKIKAYAQGANVDGVIFPKEKIMGIALNQAKKQKYSILKF